MSKSIRLICIVLLALIACGTIFLLRGPKKSTFQGHTMGQWLQTLKSNANSNEDPLNVAQIASNNKSQLVTFEVPISYRLLNKYDFLGMNGKIGLIVNGRGLSTSYSLATNGNLIMACDADNFAPGTNQIQIVFNIFNPLDVDHPLNATGPIIQFVSSNICHINSYISSEYFNGIILRADLSVSSASYSIELFDTNGNHIKTISGSTSNGIINERWDLTDDHGNIYRYHSVDAVYRVALSNSLSENVSHNYNIRSP